MRFSFAAVLLASCLAAAQAFSFRSKELRTVIGDENALWQTNICKPFKEVIIKISGNQGFNCFIFFVMDFLCSTTFVTENQCKDITGAASTTTESSEGGTDNGQGLDSVNPFVDSNNMIDTTTETPPDDTTTTDGEVKNRNKNPFKSKNTPKKSKPARTKSKNRSKKSKNFKIKGSGINPRGLNRWSQQSKQNSSGSKAKSHNKKKQ